MPAELRPLLEVRGRVPPAGYEAGLLLRLQKAIRRRSVGQTKSGEGMSQRICIVCRRYAVPGRSRCKEHGGGAWARVPKTRLGQYRSADYQRNRALALKREPTCHWGLPGCTGKSATADHLIPVARGGDNSLENLVGSCASCNMRRGGAEGRATVKRRVAEQRRGRGRT